MDNLKRGDILKDGENDYDREVIGIIDEFVITKDTDDNSVRGYTAERLKLEGWKLRGEAKELTVAEISKKLGYEVKIVE